MSDVSIEKLAIHTLSYEGKTYVCNGERTIYEGEVVWMYRTENGMDYDVILCTDRDPNGESTFYHRTMVPGGCPVVSEVGVEEYENENGKTQENENGKT